MRRIFVAAVVVVIALAFVTALLIPTPAGYSLCSQNKGKGKQFSCRVDPANPPACPPCQVWDMCICGCRNIPGCPPEDGDVVPIEMTTKG